MLPPKQLQIPSPGDPQLHRVTFFSGHDLARYWPRFGQAPSERIYAALSLCATLVLASSATAATARPTPPVIILGTMLVAVP